jgi:osmotically-inducible protein OsmY
MTSQPFRKLILFGIALGLLSVAVPASAQSPADAKKTLKAWQTFYKEPGMIEADPRYMRGTLMITGFVPDDAKMKRADELANEIKGVKEVRNRLKVRAPECTAPNDAELKAKIDKEIDEDEELVKAKAKGALEVAVANGAVTLKGKLNDYSEASTLINEVRKIPCVQTINSEELSY